MKRLIGLALALALSGCGAAYITPRVTEGDASGAQVRVVTMSASNIHDANRSPYTPRALPAAFSQVAGAPNTAGAGTGGLPAPTADRPSRPGALETRIPPAAPDGPYRLGVGDVLLLATPQAAGEAEALSGLLAAANRRQGYTVQDDGAIAVPDLGRVAVDGLSLEEAEAALFDRFVAAGAEPTFSLEVAEFNARRVSVGGAVAQPGIAPITLKPLFLDEALAQAGGVTVRDEDLASVRIYRDGTLYQVPVRQLYSNRALQRIRLMDGDAIFVDSALNLDQAERYFEQQIRLVQARQTARATALSALQTEIALRRAALQDARSNFDARLELGAEGRDYVYLTGEVSQQTRVPLPFVHHASLADVIYGEGEGVPTRTGNPGQIYVLRGDADGTTITAWQLDARNPASIVLATRFEMRPDDVIFVAEQPITRWNRVVTQFVPSLITSAAAVSD